MNKDIFRNISVAASSALPYTGGTISLLLDKFLPSYIEEQYQRFISSLEKRILQLKIKIDEEIIQSPEFFSLFTKTLDYAVCEYRKEKIIAFQNIILNAATRDIDFDIEDYFLFLTSTLTIDQFKYLFTIKLLTSNGSNEVNCYKIYNNTDKLYLSSAVTEMLRYGLIDGKKVTGLGDRYIQSINSPDEIIKVQLNPYQ